MQTELRIELLNKQIDYINLQIAQNINDSLRVNQYLNDLKIIYEKRNSLYSNSVFDD